MSAVWRDEWSGVRLGDLLARAEERDGERSVYVFDDRTMSVADVVGDARRLAKGLLAAGIGRGERVAIWMPGRSEWAAVYFALAQIGAVMVPLNVRLKAGELREVLDAVTPAAIVYDAEGEGRRDPGVRLTEARVDGAAGDSKWLGSLRLTVSVGPGELQGATSLDGLIEAGAGVSDAELDAAIAAVAPRTRR